MKTERSGSDGCAFYTAAAAAATAATAAAAAAAGLVRVSSSQALRRIARLCALELSLAQS